MLGQAAKSLYYNKMYKQWVISDHLGSMPFRIVAGENVYTPVAVIKGGWDQMNKNSYEWDPVFHMRAVCVHIKDKQETVYYPPGIAHPPTPKPTPKPTPPPTPKATEAFKDKCVCKDYPAADSTKKMHLMKKDPSWGGVCRKWGKSPRSWCYVEPQCKLRQDAEKQGTFHIDGAYVAKFLSHKGEKWDYCDECACTGEYEEGDEKFKTGSTCSTLGDKKRWCYVEPSCKRGRPSHKVPGSFWAFC
jgi:hypothetical protein